MRHSPASAFAAAGSARASRPLRGSLERVGPRPLTGGRASRHDGSAGAAGGPAADGRGATACHAVGGPDITTAPAASPAADSRGAARRLWGAAP
jgi:hypothetical protein